MYSLGWSQHATTRLLSTWTLTTLVTYNKSVNKFMQFLESKNVNITDVHENVVAEYLCTLANLSDQPKSVLNTTLAALSCYCEASNIKPFTSANVYKLVNGLIKSGTFHVTVKRVISNHLHLQTSYKLVNGLIKLGTKEPLQ